MSIEKKHQNDPSKFCGGTLLKKHLVQSEFMLTNSETEGNGSITGEENLFEGVTSLDGMSFTEDNLEMQNENEAQNSVAIVTTTENNKDDGNKKEEEEKHRKEKLSAIISIPLYQVPNARYQWGQQQADHHTVWGSLFFDLIYVGVAYQLSHLLQEGQEDGNFIGALGTFVAIFCALEQLWLLRLFFDARFDANDLTHRILHIVQGAIVAVAADSISPFHDLQDFQTRQALTFSVCLLCFVLVDSIPYFEIYLFTKENSSRMSRSVLLERIIHIAIIASSIICSALDGPFWVTALFWFLFSIIFRVRILILNACNQLNKKNLVPLHINFCIHRLGEFLMLMLGESIISIIIVGLTPTVNFIVSYFLCYFLVATLGLLIFGALPNHPDQHAMRRSSTRSMVYFVLFSIQGMALIVIGVGFKLLLKSTEKSPTKLVPYSWILCSALVIEILALFIGRVLHHGLTEELLNLKQNDFLKKLLFWFLKFIGVLTLFAAPFLNAYSWGVLLFFVSLTVFLYIIQLIDVRAFRDHHNEKIAEEVKKRIARYEAEGYDVQRNADIHEH